jgi:hypothetical protein
MSRPLTGTTGQDGPCPAGRPRQTMAVVEARLIGEAVGSLSVKARFSCEALPVARRKRRPSGLSKGSGSFGWVRSAHWH